MIARYYTIFGKFELSPKYRHHVFVFFRDELPCWIAASLQQGIQGRSPAIQIGIDYCSAMAGITRLEDPA